MFLFYIDNSPDRLFIKPFLKSEVFRAMAYNLSASQFYSKPQNTFQPRNVAYAPVFGHQVSAGAYYPANAYGIPVAQTLPLPGNASPFNHVAMPGQFQYSPDSVLPPGVNTPFRMNTTVGSTQSPVLPKPQVQQYFYTLPSVKEPPSRKKTIKKFLLITSAVVTGVFATAACVLGLMWMFWPGFVELAKNIGTNGASKAANAVKEWKKPGTLVERAQNAYEACVSQDTSSVKSGWQRLKNLFKSADTIEREGRAAAMATEGKKEAGSGLAFTEEQIDAGKVFLKSLGLDLEKLSSSEHLAEVLNKTDPQKAREFFKAILPEDMANAYDEACKTKDSGKFIDAVVGVFSKNEIFKNTCKSIVSDAINDHLPKFMQKKS
jgi:hypothetical protein